MDISIIICTYNRGHNLANCIRKLAEQKDTDSFSWEVLLVDNNSSDDTKTITDQLISKYPIDMRYVFEGEQGLSTARNKGINESKGGLLIFIDDDIHVTPNWLSSIFETYKKHDCDAVGGRIHVESPEYLPGWITPDMYGFLGHRDFGEESFQMNGRDEFPFGGNMAITRRMIEKIGFFDTRMGRKGEGSKREELFKGEETDYFHRLTNTGGTIYYEPRALVYHLILPYQLKKKFFLTLHFNAGYQKSALDNRPFGKSISGVPLFIFGQTLRAVLKYFGQVISKGSAKAFRQQMNVSYFFGLILGYHESRKKND